MNQTETITLSLRPDSSIMYLLSVLEEKQPSITRNELIEQAIAHNVTDGVDWRALWAEFLKAKTAFPNYSNRPNLIQMKVCKTPYDELVSRISNAFDPPLERPSKPFVLKLILYNYVKFLDKDNTNASFGIEKKRINYIELIQDLCELITANATEELEAISKIIVEYKKGRY